MSPPERVKRREGGKNRDPLGRRIQLRSRALKCILVCVSLSIPLLALPVHVSSAVVHKADLIRNHLEKDGEAMDDGPSTASWVTRTGNEKWKKTGVRFLTKTDWDEEEEEEASTVKNAIAESDFHIIELNTGTGNRETSGEETLRVHLMRKSSVVHPEMKVSIRDGDQYREWSPERNSSTTNCHYVGQVTAISSTFLGNSTAKPIYSKKGSGGIAVLSACTPTKGFSGLIIMKDGRQWYVEPVDHPQGRTKREAKSRSDTLEHVLLSHSDLSGHMASHISDVLRVPLPQLEEAARLAAIDAEARRNMRHIASLARSTHLEWEDDTPSSLETETFQGESSILTPFFYGGAMLPFIGRGDHSSSKASQAKKLATKKTPGAVQTTLLTPLATSTVGPDSSSYTSASIESESSQAHKQSRVVEIAVFTDEELYDKMKSKFKQDTTAQLKEYATAMVNMMDVMYQHATLGVDLRFRLVYVEVMKKRPNALKTNGGRAKAYLSSFCDYAGEKNANSAQWDHALLLTGVDLHEEGVKTTAGLAWAGTMCFRYYSCSISEGLNFASAYITTHEIGHSLGMEHDGVGISETCDSTKFIMSPTTGPGKVTWSSCSSNNLQDFIKYGTSELRGKAKSFNMISRPICLEELVSSRSKKSFLVDDSTEPDSDLKLPGEKYDANFQCSLGMGSFFKPHFERHKPPFDNICWILYCGNGTHAISTHPALEGTPCDRKKYCRSGQCVKRPETT